MFLANPPRSGCHSFWEHLKLQDCFRRLAEGGGVGWVPIIREFKLRVIRQTANARQRKILRYQAVKSKWTCCFKTAMHDYILSTQERKYETKTFNENFAKKVRICRLPFPETPSLNSLLLAHGYGVFTKSDACLYTAIMARNIVDITVEIWLLQ